jgi:nitric oxide dioxygenase
VAFNPPRGRGRFNGTTSEPSRGKLRSGCAAGEELVERFGELLLDNAPELRLLVGNAEIARQRRLLFGALVLLRNSLRDLTSIAPSLQAFGARNAARGIRPEHYPIAGAALLVSLAAVGGSAWRYEYTRAWADAYVLLQETILSGVLMARPSPGTLSEIAA